MTSAEEYLLEIVQKDLTALRASIEEATHKMTKSLDDIVYQGTTLERLSNQLQTLQNAANDITILLENKYKDT